MPEEPQYDAFLSHSHADAKWVEELAIYLEDQAGLKVWLDKWVLSPGGAWIPELAKGLSDARACVACISDRTPQGWFKQEIERALNRQVQERSFRVIPLLIPGADPKNVDHFLELRTWVDLRGGLADDDALWRLECGIQGRAPGRGRP